MIILTFYTWYLDIWLIASQSKRNATKKVQCVCWNEAKFEPETAWVC